VGDAARAQALPPADRKPGRAARNRTSPLRSREDARGQVTLRARTGLPYGEACAPTDSGITRVGPEREVSAMTSGQTADR